MKLKEVTERKASDLDEVKNYNYDDLGIQGEEIISLEGCPEEVDGSFYCSYNKLTSLEYCPKKIRGNFGCSRNSITSLKGCPERINGWLECNDNQLTSFKHFPKYIGSFCAINRNKFTSFKDIDKYIEHIDVYLIANEQNITSGYSDLFGINGLKEIEVDNKEIQTIVNKYLPSNDIIEFQDEMIKAGYESYL